MTNETLRLSGAKDVIGVIGRRAANRGRDALDMFSASLHLEICWLLAIGDGVATASPASPTWLAQYVKKGRVRG
jgi:hypothetical protein